MIGRERIVSIDLTHLVRAALDGAAASDETSPGHAFLESPENPEVSRDSG